ncbi:MAG: TolB family protein, partial [Sphingobacterium sp.]
MKNFTIILAICICALITFTACSKDGDGEDGGDHLYPRELKGTIYYDWATEGILKISLPDGTGGSFIPDDSKLNNFDISRDGKWKLTVVNASTLGKYDIRFTISDIHTGTIAEEFIYNGPGLSAYCKGYLSADNSLILVTSNDKEDGITILKRNGEFVTRIAEINGELINFNVSALWLQDNHFLLTHGNYIIRIAPPYTSGTLVKEMNYQDWGKLAVNQAGTQLAMQIANHIHTMNIDGSNLKQVTTSNFKESVPVFSPDGKHLLVCSYYRQSG